MGQLLLLSPAIGTSDAELEGAGGGSVLNRDSW